MVGKKSLIPLAWLIGKIEILVETHLRVRGGPKGHKSLCKYPEALPTSLQNRHREVKRLTEFKDTQLARGRASARL